MIAGIGTDSLMASSTVPAALAGVVHVAADAAEAGALGLQGAHQQVEQPGAHHGAARPRLEGPRDVGDDVLGREQLEALGVGLHEAVLDAVVDHLRVVARAHGAGVDEPLLARPLGAQRVEDGQEALDQGGVATRT
ncbi:MAG: hypothetical protein PGN11_15175 [Quadrisphaera sp.]